MIKAIAFDLDDTLYAEKDYVGSGFSAVANLVRQKYGVANAYNKLMDLFVKDRLNVYNRLFDMENIKYDKSDIDELVCCYRFHHPESLRCYDGTEKVLTQLKANGLKLGMITDGRPTTQTAKIEALGIGKFFDTIIITDSLGGETFRKPNPIAFKLMSERLGVLPQEMAYVGDNPLKDFLVKKYLPITTIRIINKGGLYVAENYKEGVKPDIIIESLGELI